jgi:hypothetical protein
MQEGPKSLQRAVAGRMTVPMAKGMMAIFRKLDPGLTSVAVSLKYGVPDLCVLTLAGKTSTPP